MRFKIISFFTKGNGYEAEGRKLVETLQRFSLPFDVRAIDNAGGWAQNTMHKPVFIRDMLKTYSDQAVVWLDADSEVLNPPVLFNDIETDVALYFRTTGPAAQRLQGYELITATMFFANNKRVEILLDMWIEQMSHPDPLDEVLLEQRSLQRVLDIWKREIHGTVTWLPQSYCRIFDAPEDHPVVVQNQASRRLRT